jgi:HEAT repeat protein/putative zinc finger protein
MNCNWVQENVTLYVYDELADDARYELEQHLQRCPACTKEVNATREFKSQMSAIPLPEPTPNLLAASRMRLQEALETAEQARGWRSFVLDPMAWLRRYKFSPALAAAMLIVGFFGGVGTTYKIAADHAREIATETGNPKPPSTGLPTQQPTEANIVGIRGITQLPNSNQVEINYDTVTPQRAKGSLENPAIQQLLLYAARNNQNTGMRLDSMDLLSQKKDDEHVRALLMYALRNDVNPGVRLKALEGLAPYVKDDANVRNAVLDALLNDENPGVRTQAIQLIRQVRTDGSVRAVLQHLASAEKNSSIRTQARAVLATTPQMD